MTLRHRVDAVTVTLAGKVYFGMLSPALPGQYRAWRADIGFLKLMWCAGKLPGGIRPLALEAKVAS